MTFFQPVEIGGTYIPAGTYTMFAQPYPQQWIIKISQERFIGGAENRDITKDIAAVSVPTTSVADVREYFTIGFQKIDDYNVNMVICPAYATTWKKRSSQLMNLWSALYIPAPK